MENKIKYIGHESGSFPIIGRQHFHPFSPPILRIGQQMAAKASCAWGRRTNLQKLLGIGYDQTKGRKGPEED